MTKETIITVAITYISELQTNVNNLTEQLLEMEAPYIEELETKNEEIIDIVEVGSFMYKAKLQSLLLKLKV